MAFEKKSDLIAGEASVNPIGAKKISIMLG
jgi:hypothetical protein